MNGPSAVGRATANTPSPGPASGVDSPMNSWHICVEVDTNQIGCDERSSFLILVNSSYTVNDLTNAAVSEHASMLGVPTSQLFEQAGHPGSSREDAWMEDAGCLNFEHASRGFARQQDIQAATLSCVQCVGPSGKGTFHTIAASMVRQAGVRLAHLFPDMRSMRLRLVYQHVHVILQLLQVQGTDQAPRQGAAEVNVAAPRHLPVFVDPAAPAMLALPALAAPGAQEAAAQVQAAAAVAAAQVECAPGARRAASSRGGSPHEKAAAAKKQRMVPPVAAAGSIVGDTAAALATVATRPARELAATLAAAAAAVKAAGQARAAAGAQAASLPASRAGAGSPVACQQAPQHLGGASEVAHDHDQQEDGGMHDQSKGDGDDDVDDYDGDRSGDVEEEGGKEEENGQEGEESSGDHDEDEDLNLKEERGKGQRGSSLRPGLGAEVNRSEHKSRGSPKRGMQGGTRQPAKQVAEAQEEVGNEEESKRARAAAATAGRGPFAAAAKGRKAQAKVRAPTPTPEGAGKRTKAGTEAAAVPLTAPPAARGGGHRPRRPSAPLPWRGMGADADNSDGDPELHAAAAPRPAKLRDDISLLFKRRSKNARLAALAAAAAGMKGVAQQEAQKQWTPGAGAGTSMMPNPAAAFDREDEPGDEDIALEKHRQEMEALGVRTFIVSCGEKPGLLLLPETYSTSFLVILCKCSGCRGLPMAARRFAAGQFERHSGCMRRRPMMTISIGPQPAVGAPRNTMTLKDWLATVMWEPATATAKKKGKPHKAGSKGRAGKDDWQSSDGEEDDDGEEESEEDEEDDEKQLEAKQQEEKQEEQEEEKEGDEEPKGRRTRGAAARAAKAKRGGTKRSAAAAAAAATTPATADRGRPSKRRKAEAVREATDVTPQPSKGLDAGFVLGASTRAAASRDAGADDGLQAAGAGTSGAGEGLERSGGARRGLSKDGAGPKSARGGAGEGSAKGGSKRTSQLSGEPAGGLAASPIAGSAEPRAVPHEALLRSTKKASEAPASRKPGAASTPGASVGAGVGQASPPAVPQGSGAAAMPSSAAGTCTRASGQAGGVDHRGQATPAAGAAGATTSADPARTAQTGQQSGGAGEPLGSTQDAWANAGDLADELSPGNDAPAGTKGGIDGLTEAKGVDAPHEAKGVDAPREAKGSVDAEKKLPDADAELPTLAGGIQAAALGEAVGATPGTGPRVRIVAVQPLARIMVRSYTQETEAGAEASGAAQGRSEGVTPHKDATQPSAAAGAVSLASVHRRQQAQSVVPLLGSEGLQSQTAGLTISQSAAVAAARASVAGALEAARAAAGVSGGAAVLPRPGVGAGSSAGKAVKQGGADRRAAASQMGQGERRSEGKFVKTAKKVGRGGPGAGDGSGMAQAQAAEEGEEQAVRQKHAAGQEGDMEQRQGEEQEHGEARQAHDAMTGQAVTKAQGLSQPLLSADTKQEARGNGMGRGRGKSAPTSPVVSGPATVTGEVVTGRKGEGVELAGDEGRDRGKVRVEGAEGQDSMGMLAAAAAYVGGADAGQRGRSRQRRGDDATLGEQGKQTQDSLADTKGKQMEAARRVKRGREEAGAAPSLAAAAASKPAASRQAQHQASGGPLAGSPSVDVLDSVGGSWGGSKWALQHAPLPKRHAGADIKPAASDARTVPAPSSATVHVGRHTGKAAAAAETAPATKIATAAEMALAAEMTPAPGPFLLDTAPAGTAASVTPLVRDSPEQSPVAKKPRLQSPPQTMGKGRQGQLRAIVPSFEITAPKSAPAKSRDMHAADAPSESGDAERGAGGLEGGSLALPAGISGADELGVGEGDGMRTRKAAARMEAAGDKEGKASKGRAAMGRAKQQVAELTAAEKAGNTAAKAAAKERAAKEKAEKEAAEKAARKKAEEEATEKAAREKAEKEAAEKEAAEKVAREKADKEAAKEKAAKAKAEKEAAREKAAKERLEKNAAEKAAKEKAAIEKAEKEAAEKAAREKEAEEEAEREAAERAASEKAEKDEAERRAAERAAREKAEKEAAEREAAERAARQEVEETAEKAARDKEARQKEAADKLAKGKAANVVAKQAVQAVQQASSSSPSSSSLEEEEEEQEAAQQDLVDETLPPSLDVDALPLAQRMPDSSRESGEPSSSSSGSGDGSGSDDGSSSSGGESSSEAESSGDDDDAAGNGGQDVGAKAQQEQGQEAADAEGRDTSNAATSSSSGSGEEESGSGSSSSSEHGDAEEGGSGEGAEEQGQEQEVQQAGDGERPANGAVDAGRSGGDSSDEDGSDGDSSEEGSGSASGSASEEAAASSSSGSSSSSSGSSSSSSREEEEEEEEELQQQKGGARAAGRGVWNAEQDRSRLISLLQSTLPQDVRDALQQQIPQTTKETKQDPRIENFREDLPKKLPDARRLITQRLMQYTCHMRMKNGQPSRNPRVVRFVYEDRPQWWPAELTYTKQAIDTMQWDVLKPLHARVIQALKEECQRLDWTGFGPGIAPEPK